MKGTFPYGNNRHLNTICVGEADLFMGDRVIVVSQEQHIEISICRYSIMAIMSAFQAEDVSSILITDFNKKKGDK